MHPAVYVLVPVFIILILSFRWGIKLQKMKQNLYRDFALKYRAELTPEIIKKGYFKFNGQIRGVSFVVEEITAPGGDDDSSKQTSIKFKQSPIDFDFEIKLESFAWKLTNFEKVPFENSEFNKTFFCVSPKAEKLKRLINESIQQKLIEISDSYTFVELTNDSVGGDLIYIQSGELSQPIHMKTFEKMIELIVQLLKKG